MPRRWCLMAPLAIVYQAGTGTSFRTEVGQTSAAGVLTDGFTVPEFLLLPISTGDVEEETPEELEPTLFIRDVFPLPTRVDETQLEEKELSPPLSSPHDPELADLWNNDDDEEYDRAAKSR